MRMRSVWVGVAAAALAGTFSVPATADEEIHVPLLTYRTGPFAGSGIPSAAGMRDYLRMINARDGGVNGVRIAIDECETGFDTKKGVECYEQIKARNPVVVNPYSTGITLQLIPRAAVDKIPILSMAYGLSASAVGMTFPWVFNPPATYWDATSVFIKFVAEKEGGLEKLRGKKIALLYLDSPYGKEPIPLLNILAKEYGFEAKLYPVAAQDMQNQGSVWLKVRRDNPDWIYLQGYGAMNPTAIKEAIKAKFPIDHLVANVWSSGDDDARAGGEQAKGLRSLNFHATSPDFDAIRDIKRYVVEKGQSDYPPEKIGDNIYNHGVYNSMLIVEAIRNAQKLTGKKVVNGEDVRRGLETLNITEARLKDLGLEGFAAPVRVNCADHNGHHALHIAQWDGSRWVKESDWIEPMKDKVRPLLEAAAKDYAANNPGWPPRTEKCDES